MAAKKMWYLKWDMFSKWCRKLLQLRDTKSELPSVEEYTNRENEIGNIMKTINIKHNDDDTWVIKRRFWLESFDTNFMKEFYRTYFPDVLRTDMNSLKWLQQNGKKVAQISPCTSQKCEEQGGLLWKLWWSFSSVCDSFPGSFHCGWDGLPTVHRNLWQEIIFLGAHCWVFQVTNSWKVVSLWDTQWVQLVSEVL